MRTNIVFVSLWFSLAAGQLHPNKPAEYQRLPSLREAAYIQDAWKNERVARIPSLLKKYDIDAWLMAQREHAEDPIWWSIKNSTDFDVHRRTVVLFHTNTSSLNGQPNPMIWIDNTGSVWPELRNVLEHYDPKRIAINVDRDIAFGAGLHVGELAVLFEELGEKWMSRTVNEPMLSVEYVATRVDSQLPYYRKMQEIIWALIEEGFSHEIIVPGKTTTEDLEWWFREKMQTLNVTTWSHPRISVIVEDPTTPGWKGTKSIIQEGDLLHIDFGITAMGLNTDTQHLAYVLRTNGPNPETDAPESLKEGLRKSNRMQDVLLGNMQAGLTGNEVLRKSMDQIESEGIEGHFYSHPIGDWGHDAGAVIGFVNLPAEVPILGELPILSNTYYSIELHAYHFIPEMNQTLKFRQEEDAHWVAQTGKWEFVRGRQEKLHLIDARKRGLVPFVVMPG
ncbi:hypothetical protein J132_06170 [Termitomyces sp. J132]|nr:hypothetical protein C0989_003446 [Termitomyces sp. Mn162]KAH0587832.1 hypothetical protein H2248_006590 [Termitomyces sp. 'cryptogamus']KNZ77175.1 hypothetical protein J132_06170 [Termitomyces sp. J132]